jgi:hypothetical protein
MQHLSQVQVEPPLNKLKIAAVLCATISCPRFGVNAHLGGGSPKVLSAQLSGYSATLDATSRISQTVDSALIQLNPMPVEAGSSSSGRSLPVTLLQAPCGSLMLLHQSEHTSASALPADQQGSSGCAGGRFLTLSYRPPGVQVMCLVLRHTEFAEGTIWCCPGWMLTLISNLD